MDKTSKIQVYPYGSFLKFQHGDKRSGNVFNPKNKHIETPRAINKSNEDGTETLLLNKISKPVTKLRISKNDQSEADQKEARTNKYQKIIELKNSSQDLQRLNDFFSDMSKNIYEKGDKSAMQFLQFLKSPQGDYLTTHLINKALLNEAFKIQKAIKAFDESSDGNFSDQQELLESSGSIATKENQEPRDEIPDEVIRKAKSVDRADNYIINSIDLVNHLGDLTLDKLAHKFIERIDNNIDTLNKKYPWISPNEVLLATLALRNSNDYNGETTNLRINEGSLDSGIEQVLEIFKEDLDETKNQAKARNPKLAKLLNKLIDKTQFRQADATDIRDFYMYASIKGYQEEANQVLMKAIAAQNEDPEKTNTANVYVLDKLFAFAVKEKLIENPQQFIQSVQAWRLGVNLPEGFSSISSILNPSNPSTELLETTPQVVSEIAASENEIIDSEENEEADTNLVSALIQIQENLGVEYFEESDFSRINEAIVDHLKAVKERDFLSFTQLFDQIINIDDKHKYPTLGDEIFNEGVFFCDKSFPLFDLSFLFECFTDNNSDFKHNLFQDHLNEKGYTLAAVEELPTTHLNIEYFNLYNKVLKTNATDPLPPKAFHEKLQTNELINGVIDKLPLDEWSSRAVAYHYFTLCDEAHISSANHLLNRKIEQLNDSEDSQEKFEEFADILEIFGYAKNKGLISENSPNLDNKVLKTYSKILENPSGKLEKGFPELLEIVQDEKMNPQYTIMLLNQLTGNIIQNDKQKKLLTQALKQRIFLDNAGDEAEALKIQAKRQIEKRINELADLLNLSNQLLSLEIFNAEDIEHLRKDYDDLDIIKKIDKEDISGIFNTSIQESLFSKISEYKYDNNSSKNDSQLYILIDKAFESTSTLGNFDKLSKLLNETLKETPIFHGNVKNDLKLSLMIHDHDRLPDDFFNSSRFHLLKSSNKNYSEGKSTTSLKKLLNTWTQITRMNRNKFLHIREASREQLEAEKLSRKQRKARQEEIEKAKEIRDRGSYAEYRRLIHGITQPLISQAPVLKDSENLLETVFHRILNNYEILKRQYEKFPADKIDSEILTLASRAEEILLDYKFIDKTVFADKFVV
jgi:hypothetical protein